MSRAPSDTPLMRQYLEIKEQHPDAIRFFPEFPYIGPATLIPPESVSVAAAETNNSRCVAK